LIYPVVCPTVLEGPVTLDRAAPPWGLVKEEVVTRRAVVLGLIIILALAAVSVAACGGGTSANEETAKAAVQADLTKIDTGIADLTQKGTSGSLTVADIKAARDSLKTQVEDVITQAKNIKGADVSTIQKAWTDLDSAVTALPDSATLMDAAAVLMTKVAPLTTALDKVRTLVSPSST
jgi:hypothetical protein